MNDRRDLRSTALASAALIALLSSAGARADEHRTSAMLWGSALSGTVQVGTGTAEFDLSMEDILAVLDGSITLRHEARGAESGWYGEFVFNDLKKPTSGALGERQVNLEQTILELGLSKPLSASWDAYAGARWESVDNSIDFAVLPTERASAEWVDAVIGARWHRGSESFRMWARGDLAVGGSDGALLVEAGGAWRFGGSWEFSLAYRMLETELAEGAFLIDLTQAGAVFGISKSW